MKAASILSVLLMIIAATGCYYDNEEVLYPSSVLCDTTNITFSSTIFPIFQNSCAMGGCHDSQSAMAGYDLSSHDGIVAVDPSLILGTIRYEGGYSPMPKDASKLDDCSIRKIEIWIADGLPNN